MNSYTCHSCEKNYSKNPICLLTQLNNANGLKNAIGKSLLDYFVRGTHHF